MRVQLWSIGGTLCGCIIMFASVAFVAAYFFGSWAGLAAYLRGQSVHVSPQRVHLGDRQVGSEVDLSILVRNLTLKELSIVGKRSTCLCLVAGQMPMTVPPRQAVTITVRLRLEGTQKRYQQGIVFMIAEPGRMTMHPVSISATLLNASTEPGRQNVLDTALVLDALRPVASGEVRWLSSHLTVRVETPPSAVLLRRCKQKVM